MGIIFLPLALLFTMFSPSYLLPLLIVSSVFQGASVLNGKIGDFEFGLPPYYLVALLVAIRFVLYAINRQRLPFPREISVRGLSKGLLYFTAWCTVSSFLMPHLFSGTEVYDPRGGIDQQYLYQTPLSWSLSNLAQAIYLVLDVIAVLYALVFVNTHVKNRRLVRSFIVAAALVVIIGMSQGIAALLNWSFPYEILNSNPVYSQGFDQIIGSYQRVNATFTEPSYAGAFLACAASGLLATYLRGERGLHRLFLIGCVVIVLILTTSTTGYIAFAATALLLFLFFNPFRAGTPSARPWVALVMMSVVCAAILLIDPELSEAAMSTILNKVDELSFVHRVASDAHALGLVATTYGIGTGLGSNRPSSLLTALLSTVGVPGTVLFGVVLYHCRKAFAGVVAGNSFQLAFWSLCGLLVAQILAVPDITFSVLWALLLVVAVQIKFALPETHQ